MPASFLPALDITKSIGDRSGLSRKQLSYFRNVYTVVSPESVAPALDHLERTFGVFETSVNATNLESIDDIVSLLDAGALNVFASQKQLTSLASLDAVDRNRLVLSIHDPSPDVLTKLCATNHGPLHIPGVKDLATVESCMSQRGHDDGPLFVQLDEAAGGLAPQIAERHAIPIVPVEDLSLKASADSKALDASQLFLAGAVSDRPDGLFTTIVADTRGVTLGMVYSSRESVAESLKTGRGVYHSRKRGLWYKGDTSGDIQELVNVSFDCDSDCLLFTVVQNGRGFCHLPQATCFGSYRGLSKLQGTLQSRKQSAPPGSYTARLFNDPGLLSSKIKEEANELCEASEPKHVAFEAADLIYFAMTKCIAAGVSLDDVERSLDAKSVKVRRRKGDAKPQFMPAKSAPNGDAKPNGEPKALQGNGAKTDRIKMTRHVTSQCSPETVAEALKRPSQRSTEAIMGIVRPIVDKVRDGGDKALLEYTHKFEKATSLRSPVVHAPFPPSLMQLPPETIDAINVSYENIKKFHAAQKESSALSVETMPGVVCSRFSRPIERVGLYIPGGTAVLPSTALMLGVPAMVAGCKKIVLASPPRQDGSITPEIVYVAHKVGAESIVLAGGAQAVAALAYGTESISKVDKILGPGNQFVTAGKMLVSNDTTASVSIDMPAGPSEVLVVADRTSNPAFVASDLLSQAEHGADSQVVCIAVDMDEHGVSAIEDELHRQAMALPRVDIVRQAIDHSVTLVVRDIQEAMKLVNDYAPEHLIIQVEKPQEAAALVENAGSVFIGPWTPESVGGEQSNLHPIQSSHNNAKLTTSTDYSAGVNHSLPTYGYARQYSGVNLSSYIKHITSSQLTKDGLRNVSAAVMQLAKVEELEAHRRAVTIRLDQMDGSE